MYLCRGVIVKEAVASLDPGGTPAERSVLVMDRFIGISPGRHGQKNGMVLEYYSFEPDTDGFQGKVEYFLP
jgi:hypothetical protein